MMMPGGVPLKDTMPAGMNMVAAGANLQAAQANQNAANAYNRAAIIQSLNRPYYRQPSTGNIYVPPERVPTWSNPSGY
jgi:hypothetical protein